MDPVYLALKVTGVLSIAAPYIVNKVEDILLEEGIKKLGSKYIDQAKVLLDKVRSKESGPIETALEDLSQNPKDSKAQSELHQGILKLLTENPDLAMEIESIVININMENINIYYNYGVLLQKMGRSSEAEEQYKLALKADPNDASTHSNYGALLQNIGRSSEAEEQYKLALENDPKHVNTHCNYGILLSEMGRSSEAEEQYKLAIEAGPNVAGTHYNYGTFLQNMGRLSEAEEQYKLAIEAGPNVAGTHYNYGNLLQNLGRFSEAEEQYKLALEADPKHVSTHSNYGVLLQNLGRLSEAEEQYKLAIELDPKNPNAYGAYSLFLLSLGLENEEGAIEKMKIASRLFGEKGDKIKEYLVFAWLYEELTNIYYNSKKYSESGQYAKMSGNEYIKASEQRGEKSKGVFLTKGYTLKGRAHIRKLNLQPSYDVKNYEIIMNGIDAASKCYKKAAEVSPKDNPTCNACSLSMRCLSEILNYMLAVTKQENVPKLKHKVEEWNKKLEICEKAYSESDKGKNFIQSLRKMIVCVENFEEYKKYGTWEEKRNLKECTDDLIEIAKNIEGPLQKVIEDATKQMDHCKSETLYKGTETKPLRKKDADQEQKPNESVVPKNDSGSTPQQKKYIGMSKWISEHIIEIIIGIIATVVGGIILKKV